MSYCTINDIQNLISEYELIQLSNDTSQESINEIVVNSAISYAETTINGYISSRYTLPLEAVPDLIRDLAVDLSIIRLHSRRFASNMPESIINREKYVIGELGKIQKGIINLNIETEQNVTKVADTNNIISNKTEADRIFTKELLTGF